MAEGAPINTDNNGLILFNAPLYVHSSTISQNEELLIASSRGVAEYLEFPGATPEIEGNFLRYLAAAYLETGFLVEGTRTQLLGGGSWRRPGIGLRNEASARAGRIHGREPAGDPNRAENRGAHSTERDQREGW